MGQKLFSKCYSEFLIDVIRLEFGKLFNWIQIIVQFKLQCRCFPVNFATFLRTPYFQTLRKKFPNTEFFLVRIFLYSDWILTRKAPNLDTFHAVRTPPNNCFWIFSFTWLFLPPSEPIFLNMFHHGFRPALLKRGSNTGAFLWIRQNL